MKPKNILIVAPPFIPTSKDSVAGVEQMSYVLGKSLVEQGHNVTTLAREDSKVEGDLISGGFKDLEVFSGAELEHFQQAISYQSSVLRRVLRSKRHDVVIDRCEGVSLSLAIEENGPPVICGLDMESKYFLHYLLFERLKPSLIKRRDIFAAVSNHIAQDYIQRLGLQGVFSNRMHVVYNGIITADFPFIETKEDYLLYIGRVTKGKAPHLAIKAAKDSGNRIVVAGGCLDQQDDQYQGKDYFEKEVKPLLDSDVNWFGPANFRQKIELIKSAKAVLFPSQHKEAQPLVPLEAMACGTPVIAFNHSGAMEEILNGQTGYLVRNYEEMLNAIDNIGSIDKRRCRDHVKQNFDYRKMGEKYYSLIEHLTC